MGQRLVISCRADKKYIHIIFVIYVCIALKWLTLGRCGNNFKNVIFKLARDKSTLVQVIAWCHQSVIHYLRKCWSRSMSPYVRVTWPLWVNWVWREHWRPDENKTIVLVVIIYVFVCSARDCQICKKSLVNSVQLDANMPNMFHITVTS